MGYDVDAESGIIDRWKMITAEQVTVTENAFPRSIQRIDSGKGGINDLCTDLKCRYRLRMKGVHNLETLKSRSNSESNPRRALKRRRSPSLTASNDSMCKKRKQILEDGP